MKILSIDKDKVQVELTKEDIKIIKSGLECEFGKTGRALFTQRFSKPVSQLKEGFEKIKTQM